MTGPNFYVYGVEMLDDRSRVVTILKIAAPSEMVAKIMAFKVYFDRRHDMPSFGMVRRIVKIDGFGLGLPLPMNDEAGLVVDLATAIIPVPGEIK